MLEVIKYFFWKEKILFRDLICSNGFQIFLTIKLFLQENLYSESQYIKQISVETGRTRKKN